MGLWPIIYELVDMRTRRKDVTPGDVWLMLSRRTAAASYIDLDTKMLDGDQEPTLNTVKKPPSNLIVDI